MKSRSFDWDSESLGDEYREKTNMSYVSEQSMVSTFSEIEDKF